MIPSLCCPGRNLKLNEEDCFLSKENTVQSHTSWTFNSYMVCEQDSSLIVSPTSSSSIVELGKGFFEYLVGLLNSIIYGGMVRQDVKAMYSILFNKGVHNALVFWPAIFDNLVWASIPADDVFIEKFGNYFSISSVDGSSFYPQACAFSGKGKVIIPMFRGHVHDVKLNLFPKGQYPYWVERFLFMTGVSGLTGEAGPAVVGNIIIEILPPIPSCYPVYYSISSFVSCFII